MATGDSAIERLRSRVDKNLNNINSNITKLNKLINDSKSSANKASLRRDLNSVLAERDKLSNVKNQLSQGGISYNEGAFFDKDGRQLDPSLGITSHELRLRDLAIERAKDLEYEINFGNTTPERDDILRINKEATLRLIEDIDNGNITSYGNNIFAGQGDIYGVSLNRINESTVVSILDSLTDSSKINASNKSRYGESQLRKAVASNPDRDIPEISLPEVSLQNVTVRGSRPQPTRFGADGLPIIDIARGDLTTSRPQSQPQVSPENRIREVPQSQLGSDGLPIINIPRGDVRSGINTSNTTIQSQPIENRIRTVDDSQLGPDGLPIIDVPRGDVRVRPQDITKVNKQLENLQKTSLETANKLRSDVESGKIPRQEVNRANAQISQLTQVATDISSGNIRQENGRVVTRSGQVIDSKVIKSAKDRSASDIIQSIFSINSSGNTTTFDNNPVPGSGTGSLIADGITAIAQGIQNADNAIRSGVGSVLLNNIVEGGNQSLPSNPLPLGRSNARNLGTSENLNTRGRSPNGRTYDRLRNSADTQYTGGAGIGGQLLVGGGSIQTDNTQVPSVVVNNGISTQAVPASNTVTGSGVPVTTPSTAQSSPRITWQVGNGVSGIEGDITAFQNMYNQYATENNLPTIDVDGVYGNETNNAVKLWNQNNPGSQVNVDGYTINQPDLNTSKNYIKAIGMDKTMGLPDSVFDPLATLVGYDKKTGKALYADSSNQTIGLFRDPITNQIKATNSREPDLDVFESLAKNIKATTPTLTKQNDGLTDEQRRYNFSSRLGDLGDTATAIMGATIANQKIEPYERSEEYNSVMNTLKERSTQGFTAEEQSVIDNRINNRYAQDINSIREIAGGGGNQAGVLAAMSTASRNANNSEIDAVIKGIDIQRQNESRYFNAVGNEENLNYNQYQQDLEMLMDERKMGADLITQARQNISNRRYFDNTYGPDSTYRQVQNTMINNRNRYAQQEQSALNSYNNRINAPMNLPPVQQPIQGNPTIPLGVNPLTEQRAYQLDQYNYLNQQQQRGNR